MSNPDLAEANAAFLRRFASFGLNLDPDALEIPQWLFERTAGDSILKGNRWADIQETTLTRLDDVATAARHLSDAGKVTRAILELSADFVVCLFGSSCVEKGAEVRVCEGYQDHVDCDLRRKHPEWETIKRILRQQRRLARNEQSPQSE